ncbi:MAG TPA: hypothetical protein PKX38_02355 [Alphaproteobacteria bacterium]|nr:hypothetical protein [Micavibrio sp.]HQX26762.1 hypothetical protein [Alphaproteobacteria bacterium]
MTAKTPENRNKTAKNLKSRPVEGQMTASVILANYSRCWQRVWKIRVF